MKKNTSRSRKNSFLFVTFSTFVVAYFLPIILRICHFVSKIDDTDIGSVSQNVLGGSEEGIQVTVQFDDIAQNESQKPCTV